jgi:hypothetical protein
VPIVYANDHFGDGGGGSLGHRAPGAGKRRFRGPRVDRASSRREPLILNPRDSALDQTGTKKAASGFERAPGCALSARWLST